MKCELYKLHELKRRKTQKGNQQKREEEMVNPDLGREFLQKQKKGSLSETQNEESTQKEKTTLEMRLI